MKGTLIKYAHVLKRFLFHVHRKDVAPLESQHYKKPKNIEVNLYPKITREEVFGYYSTFLSKDKFEDSVILHLMYELGLEPYRLCLLKFESLKDDKSIETFDHKTRSIKTLKVSDNLYSELLYLKNWKSRRGELILNESRISMDGSIIKGTFIFKASPTGIFNKFSRKFGGTLKNFDITPKDLIILSKYKDRSNIKTLYR